MSKSLAQKKSEKKKKGALGKSGGHRDTRRVIRAYTRGRAFIPPKPAADRSIPEMLVRTTPTYVVQMENRGWRRERDAESGRTREVCPVHVTWSDGTETVHVADVWYDTYEREEAMTALIGGNGKPFERLALRRNKALERLLAEIPAAR